MHRLLNLFTTVIVFVLLLVGAAASKKTYDLNTQTDPFFGRYAGSPFPDAVNANEKELAEVNKVVMVVVGMLNVEVLKFFFLLV